MCRCILHNTFCRMRVLLVKVDFSAARRFVEKHHQNTRRSLVTAPADLGPPKGLGFGLGLGSGSGLGLGWSGSTCKVEIDDTRPAQSCVQDAAAHSGSPNRITRRVKKNPKRCLCFFRILILNACLMHFSTNQTQINQNENSTCAFQQKQSSLLQALRRFWRTGTFLSCPPI